MIFEERFGSSKEYGPKHQKSRALMNEFGLQYPSRHTLREAQKLVENGLPFVKSIETPSLKYLLQKGFLRTEKERAGHGFGVVYASIILNKGYGPWAIVLDPKVMRASDFQAYAVDHASTYVSQKARESGLTEEDVMERYTLTKDEFMELYPLVVASMTDYPPWMTYSGEQNESKMRFITFDMGLIKVDLHDVQAIYYKTPWNAPEKEVLLCQGLAAENGLEVQIFTPMEKEIYAAETELTSRLFQNFKIPQKFREAMHDIA